MKLNTKAMFKAITAEAQRKMADNHWGKLCDRPRPLFLCWYVRTQLGETPVHN